MRVAVDTHGCRLNRSETDAMAEALRRSGHVIVDAVADAEVYLLNTCTITEAADRDAGRALRRARRANPSVRLVATGCLANRLAAATGELREADSVFGNLEKDRVGELLTRDGDFVAVQSLRRADRQARPAAWSLGAALDPGRARAQLKIQDGCNYACSFCVVPEVRGGNRSLDPEEALRQYDALVDAGHGGIVLTGVHLGTYGWDLRRRSALVELMTSMLERGGDTRLRLGSLDPHEVGDDLLDLFDEFPRKLCRHLHLPVQSGSDAVLRRMKRAHDAASIRLLLPRIRARFRDMAIGSDIIVGFPGESDRDFEQTRALLEGVGLSYAHVFQYSPRAGTEAAGLTDALEPQTRRSRSHVLRVLSKQRWSEFIAGQCGAEREAVTLLSRDRKTGRLQALTDNYVRVVYEGPDSHFGRRVRIRLEEPRGDHAYGRVVA